MPSYEGKLGIAIALAADVHKGQRDKADEAYILHPLAVMNRAKDYYLAHSDGWRLEAIMITAVLHDVLEDLDPAYPFERDRLRQRIRDEFGDEVYAAVDALTKYAKHVGESYEDYLKRVSSNWMARIVKIADLSHNLDAFRMPVGKIREYDFKRWDKYHRAMVYLTACELRGGPIDPS